jgi:non-specific serine/threonine protein kinase
VRLYRGDFMAGFSLQDSVSFDDWQFLQVQGFRSEVTSALERLVRCEGDQGELEAATGHARRWIEIDRASEKGHRQLMELYAKAGQRAAALRQYEECEKVLEKELGESPHEETRELYESIKENRIVAEVSSVKSPPVRSNNLPRQLTSFIGREREMEEVKRLLSNTCLLTLTGSGGCGKTRLALQVAADLVEQYDDGVWLVEFAPLSDPTLVPQEVAKALDVSEQIGRSLTETLSDFLRSKSLLLLLDNCEHLIGACAELAGVFLRTCPNLKILSTSREGLRITGETAWRVPSLSLPDPRRLPSLEGLMGYEAVQLFIDRAAAVQPTFTATNRNAPAVAQICHRLDGIPLAIELAAARVKALSVEEINSRLDDRFRLLTDGSRTALPRQQTLRATIDWSYNLLSEPERMLFSRLSVFAGGWMVEAAEAICTGESVEAYEVIDLLTHLVDKSLVVAEEENGRTRYRFLETVRQYARDRLLESGEAEELRGRHLKWFLGLVECAEPEFRGPNLMIWLDRLEAERDNIRAALEWSLESDKGEEGLRLAGALWHFWYTRGYWNEMSRWLEETLLRSRGASASARAKALGGAGVLKEDYSQRTALLEESLALYREVGDKNGAAWALEILGGAGALLLQGEYERAVALLEESLSLYREVRNKGGIGRVLNNLGAVAYFQDDYEGAKALSEESLSLSREVGDKRHIAFALSYLGKVMLSQGDHGSAAEMFEESLALFREVGEKVSIAGLLYDLAAVALRQGDYGRAAALYEEGLDLSREIGIKRDMIKSDIAGCIEGFAVVAGAQGEQERAARLFGAAEALREAINYPLSPADRPLYDRSVAAVRARLGEEAFREAWEEGRRMTMEEAVQLAVGGGQ